MRRGAAEDSNVANEASKQVAASTNERAPSMPKFSVAVRQCEGVRTLGGQCETTRSKRAALIRAAGRGGRLLERRFGVVRSLFRCSAVAAGGYCRIKRLRAGDCRDGRGSRDVAGSALRARRQSTMSPQYFQCTKGRKCCKKIRERVEVAVGAGKWQKRRSKIAGSGRNRACRAGTRWHGLEVADGGGAVAGAVDCGAGGERGDSAGADAGEREFSMRARWCACVGGMQCFAD